MLIYYYVPTKNKKKSNLCNTYPEKKLINPLAINFMIYHIKIMACLEVK